MDGNKFKLMDRSRGRHSWEQNNSCLRQSLENVEDVLTDKDGERWDGDRYYRKLYYKDHCVK